MAATVWRGRLSFGLVSFPVRLFRAARAERIPLRRLYRPTLPPASSMPEPESEPEEPPAVQPPARSKKGAAPEPAPRPLPRSEPEPQPFEPAAQPERVYRTRNAVMADNAGEPVETGGVVRGYEYEKGRYVVLEDEDIRRITPKTSDEMQILEFVRFAEVDPIYLETSYYLRPDAAGERPYSLLFEVLRETGLAGLARVAMHRREHVVLVRPAPSGLMAHTMYYADEIVPVENFSVNRRDLNPRELDLARRLVEALAAPFEPEKFRDSFRERLQEAIDAKLAGGRIAAEREAPAKRAQVIDIMQALEKSLNAVSARKPAARVARPARKRASS